MSIRALNDLLDALSASNPFSQLSQPLASPLRFLSPERILKQLYRDSNLSAYALSVLTQIILRDLRPLMSPLPQLRVRNPTAMLRMKSTAGPAELGLLDAMGCWDGRMRKMYMGGCGDVDWCAAAAEAAAVGMEGVMDTRGDNMMLGGPVVGVNVQVGLASSPYRHAQLRQIPKCEKGHSIDAALGEFYRTNYGPRSQMVWAETKYDGYR
jgi:DNA ligase-4